MRKQLLFVLIASGLLSAQTTPQSTSAPSSQNTPSAAASADIPPSAPVITLHGLCPDKPAGTDPKSPECQTVVTRADFEHIVQTLSPNMPPMARQTLATDYARMLVISSEARKHGLENTQHYQDLLSFLKMQLLAQEYMRSMQEQAKPSPAEVEKYYNENADRYEQLAVKRLFVPRNRPELPAPSGAKTAPSPPKPLTDAELQAQAGKLRAQLVAGGDFEKLQKQVYEEAGFKTPPPPTTIPNWPHDAIPASQQQLFELKPKEFSKVILEPAGAYIYQLEEKRRTPFDQVKPQIESTMTNERLRALVDGMIASVKPEMNQAYFRSGTPESGERSPAAAAPPASPAPK